MTYKHTISTDDITDIMIHPEPVFGDLKARWKEYLYEKSTEEDWTSVKRCIACDGDDIRPFFLIWNYRYDRCRNCASVFLNPQPAEALHSKAFYKSPVSQLINSSAYQNYQATRFQKVIKPLLSELIKTAKKERLQVLEVFGRNAHVRDYLLKEKKVEKFLRYAAPLDDETGGSVRIKTL